MGCVPFGPVSDTTAGMCATALLLYAGDNSGTPSAWLIP
jgi:hypothetical protein